MEDKKEGQSFWTTLPGILTGCAAVITAIGGLITVLYAAGLILRPTPTTTESLLDTPAPDTPAGTPVPDLTDTPQPPTPTPTLGIGSTLERERDDVEMVYVPGGTFQMGSNEGEADEQPVHAVTLEGFWIDRTEVSNAQYARCVRGGVCKPPLSSGSETRDRYYVDRQFDDYPVISVNWSNADVYCEWAGGRLPTEAEWEYAARGPDGDVYPWGNDPPDDTLLNHDSLDRDTTEVGSYPDGASWAGALDMAGNVWEWVADWYEPDYYASSPSLNPKGPKVGVDKVLRGGSWYLDLHNARAARAASRHSTRPDLNPPNVGFRCVAEPGN